MERLLTSQSKIKSNKDNSDSRLRSRGLLCRGSASQGRIKRGRSTKIDSPFGLGSIISNSHKANQRINNVFLNLKDEKDIKRDFNKMKIKVEGKIFLTKNKETGEFIKLPNGSRWNSDSRYFSKLRAKLFKEIDGLNHEYSGSITLLH